MDSNLGIEKEVIQEALAVSIEARRKRRDLNIRSSSSRLIVAFPESWSPEHWFPKDSSAKSFGETRIDRKKFPSLRIIGKDVDAMVNDAFMARFLRILDDASGKFRAEVAKAVKSDKLIVFTGHSSGGPIAIYATAWFLEEHKKSQKKEPPRAFCLTFGSPLTVDRTFCHAIRREGWSDHFLHFIAKFDIVPRILFAPPSSTREFLKEIAAFSDSHLSKPVSSDNLTSFFVNLMKNTSCVANYAACEMTGSKHTLFSTMSRFIKLSPYRPCGKYVFCSETSKAVIVENPDAVLQLLFYSLQIESEAELQKRAEESLKTHWTYKDALDKSLAPHNVVCLKELQELPLSSDDAALNDLNLCASARLCLRATGQLEQKKLDNQRRIEGKKGDIEKALDALEKYRTASKDDGVGYYDAFKLQKKEEDFKANVKRLELVAIWDEIIELLRQGDLPEEFEGDEKWVELGTRFRRLVEPIDIANYYRHSREEVAGPYMKMGRPSRYKYTQRWLEHAEQSPKDSSCESYFWAEVEELKVEVAKTPWLQIKSKVSDLENRLENWYKNKEDTSDMFLKNSTLVEWWQTLREDYRRNSCIQKLMPNENSQ